MHITIERDGCISCGLCEDTCHSVFRIEEDGLAEVYHQPQTAEEQPEQKRSYTVESGDSLGFISRKFYGDSSGIRKIMEANGLANADMIFEWQSLLIP